MGRRQQSESIEAAVDMEQRRFDEPFCFWSVPSLVESHNFCRDLGTCWLLVVVVVVVFFTLTDRTSTIPSNIRGCQSGTWSQRGTKVNGSHHGDNPLLGPTGIQIATKSYATLQAMAPTKNKTVHQTSFAPYRQQPATRTKSRQKVLINNSKFLKATDRTKIRKNEIPRSMVVEALSW